MLKNRPLEEKSLQDRLNGLKETRPLPSALRRRLRDIPHQEVLCRDVDRAYGMHGKALFKLPAGKELPGAERLQQHWQGCERCQSLYSVLQVSAAPLPVPLSATLRQRLKKLPTEDLSTGDLSTEDLAGKNRLKKGREHQRFERWVDRSQRRSSRGRRSLPVWLQDIRYGVAACYLLAFLATPLLNSDRLRTTAENIGGRTALWTQGWAAQEWANPEWSQEWPPEWARQGTRQGRGVWNRWNAQLERSWHQGLTRMGSYQDSYQNFLGTTRQVLASTRLQIRPTRKDTQVAPSSPEQQQDHENHNDGSRR